jgi:hypothetical protein
VRGHFAVSELLLQRELRWQVFKAQQEVCGAVDGHYLLVTVLPYSPETCNRFYNRLRSSKSVNFRSRLLLPRKISKSVLLPRYQDGLGHECTILGAGHGLNGDQLYIFIPLRRPQLRRGIGLLPNRRFLFDN